MSGYGAIASVYDRLNADIDYKSWADGVEAAFDRFLGQRPEIVLDLACGTGRMTYELARRGYDMIGVDLSVDMLMRARAQQTDESILWLNQDMRSFELYGSIGAVVCCLDAVNCMMKKTDLDACFATVHNYLDPDGLFLFDVNTPYKFENVFGDNAYILEDEGVFCGWQNEFDKKNGSCTFYLSVFEEDEGVYIRHDEVQREKMYTEKQLTEALQRAGFEVLGFFGGYDMRPTQKNDERWYIAAKKA
jgi:SAM-dependent methyltransferase